MRLPQLHAPRESIPLRAAALVIGLIGAAFLVYRASTRLEGEISEADGAPIPGADIVLFTSQGAIAAAHADADGWYSLRFPRGSKTGAKIAVCAIGRVPMVVERVEPVVLRADFGLAPRTDVPDRVTWPDELRGRSDVPRSCQLPLSGPRA